jgi:hypothetical protein
VAALPYGGASHHGSHHQGANRDASKVTSSRPDQAVPQGTYHHSGDVDGRKGGNARCGLGKPIFRACHGYVEEIRDARQLGEDHNPHRQDSNRGISGSEYFQYETRAQGKDSHSGQFHEQVMRSANRSL